MRKQAASVLRASLHVLSPSARNCIAYRSLVVLPPPPTSSCRSFSTNRLSLAAPAFGSNKPKDVAPPKGPIKDEAITSPFVRLVDPKTGSLAGPFATGQILSKLDRTKFFLLQVAPPQRDRASVEYDAEAGPGSVDVSVLVQFPICKLVDKKEEFDRQRALKRKASESSASDGAKPANSTAKEVQLTWSVTKNDLSHKLSKAKKEMIKGARINVVVTTKAGGKKYIKGFDPKQDESREQLLHEIEHFLCKPDGAPENDSAEQSPIARRLQDVDWQRGGSAAVMSFECFRN